MRLDQPPRETLLAADRVELPTVFTKGCPYVELKVNGMGPYRFLVDTGAEGTSITRRVAGEARIAFSRKYVARVTGSSGQSERQFMGTVEQIEAPGFSIKEVDVAIMSPETAMFLEMHNDKSAGGIIGMSSLRDVLLEIDYPAYKVSLLRPGRAPLVAARGIAYTGNRPLVTIATPAASHATTALIDTGGEGGFQLADISSYPLRVALSKADEYAFGIGGYWRPLFGQMAGDIRLGTAAWRDPEISSASKNFIGSKALASWKMVIDQDKKLLWLLDENRMAITTWDAPLEPDGRPAVYGFAFIPDGDAVLVKEVDPGSRAERAGLKIGDRILSPGANAGALESARQQHPHVARLHIVRGGEKFDVTMSLLDPLPATVAPAATVPEGKAAGEQN